MDLNAFYVVAESTDAMESEIRISMCGGKTHTEINHHFCIPFILIIILSVKVTSRSGIVRHSELSFPFHSLQ